MTNFRSLVVFTATVLTLTGCSKQAQQPDVNLGKNLVTAGSPTQDRLIGEDGQTFRVMAEGAVESQKAMNLLDAPDSVKGKAYLENITQAGPQPKPKPRKRPVSPRQPQPVNALTVGIPVTLLNEQYVLDAVITRLSDKNNEDLGNLKLTDLTPVHVVMGVAKASPTQYMLVLFGCAEKCSEASSQEAIVGFPIKAVDTKHKMLIVDLSAVGNEMDLLKMLDPAGNYTHLQSVSANTASVDYSYSTLVFDIESHMVPVSSALSQALADPKAPQTVFTTRWFLRLGSAFNPAFQARTPTPGVGFFETNRASDTKITRWSTTSPDGVAPVHYYIKNVPAEYQPAFQSAFDEWNEKLKPVLGKEIFSYEFVAANDPRNSLLVAGDPRFNIVEWDLMNKASYGGLGPSIANQYTGENLTANVLIQGPTIETLFKAWFKVNQQAQELRLAGQPQAADALLVKGQHQIFDKLDELANTPKLQLHLTTPTDGRIEFRVNAQRPELNDPLAQHGDFEPTPVGVSYDKYMYGYFHDMLTHELGHNLGLRHNFKGNLGSTATAEGEVSRSIMEYLGRSYRYLDHVGEYDLMALTYGYTGVLPAHTDWFCTDEDKVSAENPTSSAECSADDATGDPFSWDESRLARAINYLVARGDKGAPVWTVKDMGGQLQVAVQGMGYYASTAAATASTWTNFAQGAPNRPAGAEGVTAYVVAAFKAQLCDPSLETEAASKSSPDATLLVEKNVADLRAAVVEILAPLKVISADDLKCN